MDPSEAQTRQQIIDAQLKRAGWDLKDRSQVIEELDIVTGQGDALRAGDKRLSYAGHKFADYALLLKGKPAAVLEAKRTSVDAEQGRDQALKYAKLIQETQGGDLPLVFYSNGHSSFFWEHGFYPPEPILGFPSREELQWLCRRREGRKPLSAELIPTDIAGRDYQIAAIRRILEEIQAKRRKLLLVMATGTGKTRTAAALIKVLMKAQWARRVLFLVDRLALQEQALDAFRDYLPHEPRWPKQGEKPFATDRRLYCTTYPTMLNLIQKPKRGSWISPFFFDLVIADESHRSIYNEYTQVLSYFHAIKLGLTATPKDHIEANTFSLFDCGNQDPTFAYSYEEALAHRPPYLCGFQVLNVRTKFQMEGIKGKELSLALQEQLEAQGKDLEDINYEGTDLEKKVTNAPTNVLIVREFMEECLKSEDGVLPGKSIIFAMSKAHARRLERIFDALYPQYAGELARVLVTGDKQVHGKGGLLDQFKNKDMPRVAISVDMLDTGVDVREVVNLVFAKPVYSYVKFWQMIGRGTRVLEEDPARRKPWCRAKDKFLIVDCWDNFAYFKLNPEGREPGQQEALPVRLFRARLNRLEAALEAGDSATVDWVKAALRKDLNTLPKGGVLAAEHAADLAKVGDEVFWHGLKPAGLRYLRTNIAPLLRGRGNADFKALSFEVDLNDLGRALLKGDAEEQGAAGQSLLEKLGELPLSVNVVRREEEVIQEALRPGFLAGLSQSKLEELAVKLAPLMKHRVRQPKAFETLSLQDLRAVKEYVEFGPGHERLSTSAYREKAEALVRSLVQQNAVLQKIQSGAKPSERELKALADFLQSQELEVTESRLRQAYAQRRAGFLELMRYALGLDKAQPWEVKVTTAFEIFIRQHSSFSSAQLRFLETLKTFLLNNGQVARENLVSDPFTRLHPQGIQGLFGGPEIEEILALSASLSA
jgi:type I restriction enzyme R subunit